MRDAGQVQVADFGPERDRQNRINPASRHIRKQKCDQSECYPQRLKTSTARLARGKHDLELLARSTSRSHDMQNVVPAPDMQSLATFVDRRQTGGARKDGGERRQFVDSRQTFRPEVIELAEAVDQYKLRHRRRFITFEELYDVIAELGYRK
jgi:hypothetical protein